MRGIAPWQALIIAAVIATSVEWELCLIALHIFKPTDLTSAITSFLFGPLLAIAMGGLNAAVFLGAAFAVAHRLYPGKTAFSIAGVAAGALHILCSMFLNRPGPGVPDWLKAGPLKYFWAGFLDGIIQLPWWALLATALLAGWAAGWVYWWAVRWRVPPRHIDP